MMEASKQAAQKIYEHEHLAQVQAGVDEIQRQINSQVSRVFGNSPISLEQHVITGLRSVNEFTSTTRYGNDLRGTLGSSIADNLNHILTSQKVDGVTFGTKLFITQEGKLSVKVVATDEHGSVLAQSHGQPAQVNYQLPTRTIHLGTASTRDLTQALASFVQTNHRGNTYGAIVDLMKNLAMGHGIDIPTTAISNANNVVRDALTNQRGYNKDARNNFQDMLNNAMADINKDSSVPKDARDILTRVKDAI